MAPIGYQLPPPPPELRKLASGWLLLALLSLVGSGLVVVLVVLARTPVIHDLIPGVGSFKTALVVHVDLSVLVWFLAFAAFLGSLTLSQRFASLGWGSLVTAAAGALLITLSPLGGGQPYLNNYVPVLENLPFFLGTGLFSAGVAGAVFHLFLASRPSAGWNHPEGALQFALKSGLAVYLLSALAWIWTYATLPPQDDGQHYYEVLFWGGGHLLQFTHTQLLVLVWLWLTDGAAGGRIPIRPLPVAILFALGVAPAFVAPVAFLFYEVDSIELRSVFTTLMRDGNALAAVPLGAAVLYALARAPRVTPENRPAWYSLLFSLLLFAAGGVIGFLIDGVNVTIPAHYHGSIVAVTMAYMGLTYHLLPRLGYRPAALKWATWQPILYGIGQGLHVLGLAWGGGYGVQRKTAGAAQELKTLPEQLAMGMVGVGGVIAILAGALFLVITLRAIWLSHKSQP